MNLRKARSQLTPVEYSMLSDELRKKGKKEPVAYVAFIFGGLVGAHRFYMEDNKYAIGMAFTLGGLGMWALIDAFNIKERVAKINEGIEHEIIQEMIAIRDE